MTSRRSFVGHIAGIGSAVALADWALVDDALAHAAAAVAAQPRPAFKVLSAAEGRDLEAITSRIVPTTDTPGAREAGVVFFIDQALTTFQKDALGDLRKALTELNQRAGRVRRGASFAALTEAQQDAILVAYDGQDGFGLLRFLTFMGMFGEPSFGGNRNEVGWKLLDFRAHGPHKPPFGYYDAQVTK
ncbi:MAG: gluconate 2-dehydrogenase subunit 3 family protein [Gemmatimonadetes bacterium]|nr:gluconate 2-dehydrogenase subunit 3 family protein [Gemmatimonadota bacterium]